MTMILPKLMQMPATLLLFNEFNKQILHFHISHGSTKIVTLSHATKDPDSNAFRY